jgi:nitroreductase
MDVEQAIRTRRTHKVYGSEPVDRSVLDELFELARWAPNHHLTFPWRFRVLGPESLDRLKAVADELEPGASAKLERAPTLVAVSAVQRGDALADREDLLATAVAAYIVLLAAHARGYAGYWRTPAVLREPAGRAAVGIGSGEAFVGLLHLGPKRQERTAPERSAPEEFVTYLD